MKIDWKKDWMTTVGAVISAALVVGGFVWPDKIDDITKEVISTATNELMTGAGVLVGIVNGWLAKDPVITLPKLTLTK